MVDESDHDPERQITGVASAIDLAQEAFGSLGEVVPRLVDRSRRQVDFAMAVIERLRCGSGDEPAASSDDEPAADDGDTPAAGGASPTAAPAPLVAVPDLPPIDAPDASSLSIPDYDSLAASQVLPRLAGLEADELEAIRSYEAAHRNRRTILGRLTQLLG